MQIMIEGGYLYFSPDAFISKPENTLEENLENIKLELFKKKYPFWSDVENNLKKIRSGIRIYKD